MRAFVWSLVAAIVFSGSASAETLTNADVVKLLQAGLGSEAVIAKIKASDGNYNLSTSDLIGLKDNGVPGEVIAAMLAQSAPKAPALSLDAADPMVPHYAGLYIVQAGSMRRIEATSTSQAKTGGLFGYVMTAGLASMSVKAAIQGENAKVRTKERSPRFYVFFDESNGVSATGAAWGASGGSTTITSPAELTLTELREKDHRREARVGSTNIAGSKTGVMDSDRIEFAYNLVRPGVYEIKPVKPLKPGEYAFLSSISGGRNAGMMTARVFDFGIDK